ncbi:MAG: TIGR03067 domain-containing protein [Acidobacteriota bacterium]|nr:TIGR03067 domain-containing protein [Acidobacteriota bacterium]
MNDDLNTLQGVWSVQSVELAGSRVAPAFFAGATIVVAGRRFESLGMGATYAGELTVDDAPRPKQFAFSFTSGPEQGNTNLGIYQLAGDTWTICVNTKGGRRPRAFTTTPGSGDALEVLTRKRS